MKKINVALILAMAGISTAAYGEQILQKGNWAVDDIGSHCVASTQIAGQNGTTYRLELSLDKSNAMPLEIFVRSQTANAAITGMTGSGNVTYSFGKIVGADGSEIFWQVPQKTEDLIDFLRQEDTFTVRAIEGSKKTNINFSLSGSTAVIGQLLENERCGSERTVFSNDFEKAFLPAKVSKLDVTKLTSAQATELRNSFSRGFNAYFTAANMRKNLADMKVKFDTATKQQDTLNKEITGLQAQLPSLNTKKSQLETKIAQANGEIAKKDQLLAEIQPSLNAATAEYEQVYQTIAPLIADQQRLSSDVRDAQSDVNRYSSRLSEIDGRISSLESEVSSLQQRASSLRSELQNIVSNLGQARVDAQRAQDAANRFDESFELQQKLNSDSWYRNYQQQDQTLKQQRQQKQGEMHGARNRAEFARRELQVCQAIPNANCSSQQQKVNEAESNLQNIQSQIQSLDSQIQTNSQNLTDRENTLRREIHDAKMRLVDEASRLATRVLEFENSKTQYETAINQIMNQDIPDKRSEISSLRSERLSVESSLKSARSALNLATSAYNNWKAQTGWDAKKAVVDQAAAKVNTIRRRMDQINDEKDSLISTRDSAQSDLDKTVGRIAKISDDIKTRQEKIVELQTFVANYQQEKAKIEAELVKVDQALAESKTKFASNIP